MSMARVWRRSPPRPPMPTVTRVRVKGAFQPDALFGRVDEPMRIIFRREEAASSTERVVFPAFGRSVALPTSHDVTVDLLPEEPGDYEFTCQLGLLKGRLHVLPARPSANERSTA